MREKWRKLRDDEGEAIIAIPFVVGLVVVRVQPAAIVITIRGEQIRIAVRNTQETTCATAPWSLRDLGAVSNSASQMP